VSKYMELKAQIEAMQQQLERVRLEELDEQVADIKQKIIAFGITPDMLFAAEAGEPSRSRKDKTMPPKFSDGNGNTWAGKGPQPQWVREALASGKTLDDLRIKA